MDWSNLKRYNLLYTIFVNGLVEYVFLIILKSFCLNFDFGFIQLAEQKTDAQKRLGIFHDLKDLKFEFGKSYDNILKIIDQGCVGEY